MKIFRFKGIILLAIILFIQSGCDNIPIPETPEEVIAITSFPSGNQFVSNEKNKVDVKINKREYINTNIDFKLYLTDGNYFTQLVEPDLVNLSSSPQTKTINLLFRMSPSGGGMKKIPVPFGTYKIEADVRGARSKKYTVTVVGNNYDSDNDDFSNVVEIENSSNNLIIDENGITHANWYNQSSADFPPIVPSTVTMPNKQYNNRGTHDWSVAEGTRSSGTLQNGVRIANEGTGYRYFRNTDIEDTDNWGTLVTINLIERGAREWHQNNSIYPITTLDISKQFGGEFTPHKGHKNGLDVDIMYIGTGSYIYGAFIVVGAGNYDATKSKNLMDIFNALPYVNQIFTADQTAANASSTDKIKYDAGHDDHFHVDFNDPDGVN